MAFVENQGTKIYWDEKGQGAPVLLIMGLGWPSYLWFRTQPILAERYRAITFDNRGVGQSDVPPGPYSMAAMASDASAVLDAAGVHCAHIYGVSMGGMIAQEFALQYPQKVRSLILGCTAAGGPHAVRAEAEALQVLLSRGMTPEEFSIALNPFIYDADTLKTRIEEDYEIRRKWFAPPQGYLAQLQAILAWEAYSRISQIAAPTLVIHGENDRLVPCGNGKLIAERITGAKLVLIPHASHIFSTDQPEIARNAVLDFLSAQPDRQQPRKGATTNAY